MLESRHGATGVRARCNCPTIATWRHSGTPRQVNALSSSAQRDGLATAKDVLLRLAELDPSPLERSESLEQLRALENGIPIRVRDVAASEPGVDTPEDLARAEALLPPTMGLES